jgi:hypothetical protein
VNPRFGHDVPHLPLAGAQRFDDSSPGGIGEGLERV